MRTCPWKTEQYCCLKIKKIPFTSTAATEVRFTLYSFNNIKLFRNLLILCIGRLIFIHLCLVLAANVPAYHTQKVKNNDKTVKFNNKKRELSKKSDQYFI